jgi:hypothetical protein
MKYVLIMTKRNKKVPLPVDFHLKQAVGALTLHTGRNYMICYRHKKCPQQKWRAYSPVSNGSRYKDGDSFWKGKINIDFFAVYKIAFNEPLQMNA